MAREFIVGFSMVSGRNGEIFSSAPVIPIRIAAEDAVAALNAFAQRSEGTILETSRRDLTVLHAKVGVDGRIFRVHVSDFTQ